MVSFVGLFGPLADLSGERQRRAPDRLPGSSWANQDSSLGEAGGTASCNAMCGFLNGKASTVEKSSGVTSQTSASEGKVYFSRTEHYRYAGTHLLLDFWGAKRLDDIETARRALVDAVAAAGCTLLDISLHRFSPYGGFSGVAVLSESHISIHTWPELGFAALDIFTCGNADPHGAVPVLKEAFEPERIQLTEHRRGIIV